MKIVDAKTFLTLPKGTVYAKYRLCGDRFDDFSVKGDTIHEVDFITSELVAPVDYTCVSDFVEIMENAYNGSSFLLDFDITMRDGCFDEQQMYAVYEKEDLEKLIYKLQSCLSEAY